MLLLCIIWLELCITLTDARKSGGGGGDGEEVSRGSSSSSSSSSSVGRPGGRGGFMFLGGSSRRSHSNNNNTDSIEANDNEDETPLVWTVFLEMLMATIGLCGVLFFSRQLSEYFKSFAFENCIVQAKNQVVNQKKQQRLGNTQQKDSNNNNMRSGRPPANGNYVATYAIKCEAFSSTTALSFSPLNNMEDNGDTTSWLISGSCRNTNLAHLNACTEFTITEGMINVKSGHAYWVQQQKQGSGGGGGDNVSRSLSTGKFEFDDGAKSASNNNWCSFTGSIVTCKDDHRGHVLKYDVAMAEYTSFQLEKDSVVVVHGTSSSSSSYDATTDVESNDDDDDGDNATIFA
jgi:hypothetical protein